MEKRKGARRMSDIPPDVLESLHTGRIESVNLVEWLAVDARRLLDTVLEEQNLQHYKTQLEEIIPFAELKTTVQRIPIIGRALLDTFSNQPFFQALLQHLSTHTSDTVRSWACYMIAKNDIDHVLNHIKPFAQDANPGVREVAWMAARVAVDTHLPKAIFLLQNWVQHPDYTVRRFASEVTRPRGVWCKHIDQLKQNPSMAINLLEPLKADTELYVQNSVANWLNDASKHQPEWVIETCIRWEKESPYKSTQYICKRALRTLNKQSSSY